MNRTLNATKLSLVMSCATVALLAADAAWAAEPVAQSAQEAGSDIIVTAQHRNETLSSVPLTVQALSGRELSQLNVTTFNDLLKYTPNVTFGNNGPGQGAIFIRGLSAGFAGNQSSGTIGQYPNVAIFLDEQSMQFPARNADVYLADMTRVEVLEGPQGTLFGGSSEAGAVRYITNKPNTHKIEGTVDVGYGGTAHGGANSNFTGVINLPIIKDKLAVRAVVYGERRGGYIDNVASNFTHSNYDPGIYYINLKPNAAGVCPNGLGTPTGFCAPVGGQTYNNATIAGPNSNPTDYSGYRVSAQYDIDQDWNFLISQSYQNLDAQGISATYSTGSDFQTLGTLQNTVFTPSYNKDRYWNTAWTLNGKIGDFKVIYTGGYTVRHIEEQMDYTNYSRTAYGVYYTCSGGTTGFGPTTSPGTCYSPLTYWHDNIRNTHQSHEFRVTSPDTSRFRVIAGAYWERFKIQDVMNFDYKSIPSCTPTNLALAKAGGAPCVANISVAPNSTANDPTIRADNVGFGEDTQRGYDQLAFFGSADFDIIPKVLTLSGGTRYYKYTEYLVGSQYGTGTGCTNIPNGGCVASVNIDLAQGGAGDHVTYTGFKSRGELTWHAAEHTLAYALFSQGFRPGGFNRSSNQVAPIGVDASGKPLANDVAGTVSQLKQFQKPNGYAPDSLDNFEIGLKTELLDRKLQLNMSAYLMNWRNVQLNFYNPAAGLGNTSFALNGPNYRVKGAEIQFIARPTRNLTVQGSLTYNDNQQTNSPCFVSTIATSPTVGQCITQTYAKGLGTNVPFSNPFGSVGTVAAFAPHFQGDIRMRYNWTINDMKAFFTLGGTYNSAEYSEPATYPAGDVVNPPLVNAGPNGTTIPGTTLLRYRMPGYGLADASIGLSRDNWTVTLYGNNITNSHASTFTSSTQFIKTQVPLRPLTFGLKVGTKF